MRWPRLGEPGTYVTRAALHAPLRRRGRPAMVGRIVLFVVQVGDGVHHCKPVGDCRLRIADWTRCCLLLTA